MEMGRTDGTSAGTELFDLGPAEDSYAAEFTPFAGRLFFTFKSQLWSLTSSEAPAQFYAPNSSGASYVEGLTVVGDKMFFSATDGVDNQELWMTTGDPTDPDATNLVGEINSVSSSWPTGLTAFGSRVYFSAFDGTSGYELWSSNGSATSRVADMNAGSGSSNPDDLTVFAGALYVSANGGELWRVTDSLTAKRHSMVPLRDDDFRFYSVDMSVAGDKLYLHTNDAEAGREYAWMQAPAAPASVSAPTITGTAKVGRVLTSARGSWTGVPSAITSAQWYRCTKSGTTTPTSSSLSGCVAISGATKPTYKAAAADKGKYLRLRVKAQNESGTVYRWSKATGKIAP
jgi:ELWxxDGT repeat protein